MAPPQLELPDLVVSETHHLPIIAAFCRRIGIPQIINRLLPTKMDLDAGTIIVGMILDTLSGRTPLYRLPDFFENRDPELLLGRSFQPSAFNDDAVGRVLDRLYNIGTEKIFTEVSLNACNIFDIQTNCGHFDTTSVNVWGDYESSTADGNAPHIIFGYSKDKRPDLKQFIFSLLCVEGNIPLVGKVQDGNAADTKLNNEELQRVSALIKATGQDREDFLYIADCKVVTEDNLKLLGNHPFITRLPASYKAHSEAVDRALAADNWEQIGTLNQTLASTKRPAAEYKASEQEITLYGTPYRAIVIHSSNHDKRRTKRIERELKAAKATADKECQQQRKEQYQCRADAEAKLRKVEQIFRGNLWEIQGEIEEIKTHGKGRPPKERPRPVKSISYRLKLNSEENSTHIVKYKERAGCFVILTNTPKKSAAGKHCYNPKECLQHYKGQSGVERNFSFLKEPLIVNDIFLKKPSRIDALGLVMLLSLLVWSLMERTMRKNQTAMNLKLKNLDKRETQRPTSFIMVHKFHGILVIRHGKQRLLARKLRYEQNQYLIALGLTGKIFTTPPSMSAWQADNDYLDR